MGGDSVATVQANLGHKLAKGIKENVKAQRKSEQETLRPQIEAKGGRVIGSYQSAMNGLKVKVARNKIADLRELPGVVDVKLVNVYTRDNTVGVPRVQAPTAWTLGNFRGEGQKVAIVDTGIDYTHANFGGPGTVAAYQAAKARRHASRQSAALRSACAQSEGRHRPRRRRLRRRRSRRTTFRSRIPIRSTAIADTVWPWLARRRHGRRLWRAVDSGTTYTGPYDATTYTNNTFRIGPGVAPKADLYAVRVFGCAGLDRSRGRGAGMGRRSRHGRRQHVARLDVTAPPTAPTPSPPTMP